MAKSGMRDAKLVGVTEVLADGGGEEEQKKVDGEEGEVEEKERENAWVRVCLKEALGQFKSSRTH